MEASCIIPAFENIQLVGRCVLSAVTQQAVDLEVIVTDDSHSSAVRELVAALTGLFPRLAYAEGPRTGNPVDNWNHGLDMARGETCVVAHQDEFFIDSAYLRRAIDALAGSGAPAVIGPTVVIGYERRSNFAAAAALARTLGRPIWALPSLNWIGPTAAFVFRRGPRFDRRLVQLVDVDFYARVLGNAPGLVLEGPCVGSLGHHRSSITATIDPRRKAVEELRLLRSGAGRPMPALQYAAHRAWIGLRSWRR